MLVSCIQNSTTLNSSQKFAFRNRNCKVDGKSRSYHLRVYQTICMLLTKYRPSLRGNEVKHVHGDVLFELRHLLNLRRRGFRAMTRHKMPQDTQITYMRIEIYQISPGAKTDLDACSNAAIMKDVDIAKYQ